MSSGGFCQTTVPGGRRSTRASPIGTHKASVISPNQYLLVSFRKEPLRDLQKERHDQMMRGDRGGTSSTASKLRVLEKDVQPYGPGTVKEKQR